MALMETDEEELLQRRLEDKIRENVEDKLFRYYRNVGSMIIAAFGVVGVTIGWPALENLIKTTITTQIENQVKEPVKRAKETAHEAERIVAIVLERIQTKQDDLHKSLGRLGVKSDDLSVEFAKVNEQITRMIERADELKETTDLFQEQFRFTLATQDDLKVINKDIGELALKSKELADAIQRLQTGDDQSPPTQDTWNAYNRVATQAQERAKSVASTSIRSTVYVQFAGGRREDIRSVSEILKAEGWLIPGLERTSSAASKKEVRYFYEGDAKAATKLADDVTKALADIGFDSIVITSKNFTSYQKPPRPGVLELWVEIPLRRTGN